MKITILDSKTLGEDLDLSPLIGLGQTEIYENTSPLLVAERINNSEVVVINKVKLDAQNLSEAKALRLICVAATGYDNIDIEYCKKAGIGVCNVVGYSTDSVAQLTVGIVLSLVCHLPEHINTVASGAYTESGVANRLTPVYHELAGKTWGIVGYGNIGRKVANIAKAFGCNVLANRKSFANENECVSIETLCRTSDIITIHTPLNESTRGLIDKNMISLMKKNVVIVNTARGAVTDERALAEAVKTQRIGALGCDVYSVEPFGKEHPFYEIKAFPNVCLTPHMAWGAYEARERCLYEIVKNIKAFYNGELRSRVDLK